MKDPNMRHPTRITLNQIARVTFFNQTSNKLEPWSSTACVECLMLSLELFFSQHKCLRSAVSCFINEEECWVSAYFSDLSKLAWILLTRSWSILKKTLVTSYGSSSPGRDHLSLGTICGESSKVTGSDLLNLPKSCRSDVYVWSLGKRNRSE